MGSTSALTSLLGSGSSASSSMNLSSLLQAATGASSSGIDVSAAVAAAVYAAQAPERQWAAQQTTVKGQITALSTIQNALTQLKSDLDDLNDLQGSLAAKTVTSSSAAVTATASASATAGTHSVSVQALASAAAWYSPAVAHSGSGLRTSTLTIIAAGGQQTTFTTGSGTNSIAALAGVINASSAGVQANVVTDATGSRLRWLALPAAHRLTLPSAMAQAALAHGHPPRSPAFRLRYLPAAFRSETGTRAPQSW